ncbi:Crp/Fnr family transcriptional regulator [Chryseolinea soli]|uniref:Crp/Fnr family transcriptional regulator n=1 Tax=Chryseolinea soli TaxID=2321403 RepID=A0A385SYP5_9BACT|nr:Crp/Fnr family transcriptional regulator [Chryseolinea soli]AYB34880.1 Crp/Fnr family transcriptional regulator [Chryseolinea soli]
MYDTLVTYINRHVETPLTSEEIDAIQRVFVPRKFRKRQYFLQEGEVCKHTAFILKGAMRQYTVGDKGEEHIIRLSIENWWATDRESLIKETPSIFFIDAWEETETLIVTKSDLTDLVYNIPTMTRWIRAIDDNFAAATQRRLNAAISLSAEDRYHDLEKNYPEFLQRFPKHIIASYLGINRETLSRINSRGTKK